MEVVDSSATGGGQGGEDDKSQPLKKCPDLSEGTYLNDDEVGDGSEEPGDPFPSVFSSMAPYFSQATKLLEEMDRLLMPPPEDRLPGIQTPQAEKTLQQQGSSGTRLGNTIVHGRKPPGMPQDGPYAGLPPWFHGFMEQDELAANRKSVTTEQKKPKGKGIAVGKSAQENKEEKNGPLPPEDQLKCVQPLKDETQRPVRVAGAQRLPAPVAVPITPQQRQPPDVAFWRIQLGVGSINEKLIKSQETELPKHNRPVGRTEIHPESKMPREMYAHARRIAAMRSSGSQEAVEEKGGNELEDDDEEQSPEAVKYTDSDEELLGALNFLLRRR